MSAGQLHMVDRRRAAESDAVGLCAVPLHRGRRRIRAASLSIVRSRRRHPAPRPIRFISLLYALSVTLELMALMVSMTPVRSATRRSRPTEAIKTLRRPATARGVLNGAARRSEDAEPEPRFTGLRRRFSERMGLVDHQVHELSGPGSRAVPSRPHILLPVDRIDKRRLTCFK